MTCRTMLSISVISALCFLSPARSDAPDNTFKKASGRMYCEAPAHGQACHDHGTLTISLDPGYTIDHSYHQGLIPCCGGEENGNRNGTEIPGGVYMEFAGGNDGEWGVFNIKLVADSGNVDDKGLVRAWTITGDVYCGPSAGIGKGGCSVNAYGWVKQKRAN
jgi:hypothetical protein